jgi:hypothetical protein
MLPKKWCPASIISFDEYWFVVDDDGSWEGGAGGGIVPVVWAMPDVDAATTITLAMAAARKLALMAGSQCNSRKTSRSGDTPLSSRN